MKFQLKSTYPGIYVIATKHIILIRKVLTHMISNIFDFEKSKLSFINAFRVLKLNKLLNQSNITKAKGHRAIDIFLFIFSLAFTNKSLYRHLQSNKSIDDNTFYRFLNNSSFNWRKFIHCLCFNIISEFKNLTSKKRVKVLILDDTVLNKSRSKKSELLAKVYDHVNHVFVKGYTLLTLAYSDGFTTIPVDFALLSSTNTKNRYNDMLDVSKKTVSYKRRLQAISSKPDASKNLVENAIKKGITANYILCDSWFTNEPFILDMLSLDMHVIAMVKQLKQVYLYKCCYHTLNSLFKLTKKSYHNSSDIISSLIVKTKAGIDVKLVFVKNKNKKNEYLTLLCTDITVEENEILRIYGNRWSIEVMFKVSKDLLKLNKEFKTVSFDMMISHISIVFTRYMILEYLKRIQEDVRYGRTNWCLYYDIFDEVKDIEFLPALNYLLTFFDEIIKQCMQNRDFIISQVVYFISLLPRNLKDLVDVSMWES